MRSRSMGRMLSVATLVLAVAACGGDDDDSTEPAADDTAADEADTEEPDTDDTAADEADTEEPDTDEAAGGLGEPSPATGASVKIGLITEEGSQAIGGQSLETIHAFEMGIEYLNEYRGGLAGHEIELFACGNEATPAGAQDCAQQMVEQDVVAVVLPFDCCGDDQVPIVVDAGIPYVVASGSAASHLTTPGAFSITGGYVAILGAVAAHASEQGIEKVTHVVIDVPSAVGAATDAGNLVFANAGVEYEVVTAAPGTPDLTPQLSAAGDSAVMVTGDLSFCTSFNQAYATLGLTNTKYQIATCIDPSVLESVPDAFDGSYLATGVTADGADAELYAAILGEYDDTGIEPNPYVSGGTATPMTTILTFGTFFDGFEGELTAEAAMEQMRTATDVPIFLSSGATATCDGTAIPILPNVCAFGMNMATLDASGVPADVVPVDLDGLYTPPS